MVAALACSLGLHWGLFQSVAWMRMVIHYSQAAPLTEALAKTFDGKRPSSTSVFLGPQISYTWSSRLSAQVGADLPVSIVSSGEQLVPNYRG
jgi:hypothetical protein